MPFVKGKSGNPAGKKPGTLNKATKEIQEFAGDLIEDPDYVASLKRRLASGKAPHMETLMFHYKHGKPKDTVKVEGSESLAEIMEMALKGLNAS